MDRKTLLPCSHERVLEIWRSSVAAFDRKPTPLTTFQLRLFSPDAATNNYIGEPSWIEHHRDALLHQTENEEVCMHGLDDFTSTFIKPKFYVKEGMENEMCDQAMSLLSRLPKEPPQQCINLLGDLGRESDPFEGQIQRTGDPENIQTLDLINTNVIRLALLLALMDGNDGMILNCFGRRFGRGWQLEVQSFIDAVAGLIAAIREFSADSGDCRNIHSLFQESFLYIMWQQSLALYLSWTLQNELHGGYAHYRRYDFRVLPSPSQYVTRSKADTDITLETSLLGVSKRTAHHALGAPLTHAGDSSGQELLTSRPMIRYSVWASNVENTTRIESHTSRNQEAGQYAKISETTMAILHVWNHGQGGRPETGYNACLHERYSHIAIQSGYSSYWMDTPCIPSEHELRNQAIREINNVFTYSNMTLVCDKDIMKIDIKDLTIKIRESILAALLVCDWNTRSWALLEAIRADHNIHLLCKDNKIISLKENLDICNRDGSLDIANLFLTARHLIPRERTRIPDLNECNSSESDNDPEPFRKFAIEEAAVLLSNRVASRPGDEIVI
ncbi:hypothetical protein B0J14DRAFT_557005 [Halenospora varia]|nr:hypothetical protein B0J14DRAFT_557005 [Halenospora varia]